MKFFYIYKNDSLNAYHKNMKHKTKDETSLYNKVACAPLYMSQRLTS